MSLIVSELCPRTSSGESELSKVVIEGEEAILGTDTFVEVDTALFGTETCVEIETLGCVELLGGTWVGSIFTWTLY